MRVNGILLISSFCDVCNAASPSRFLRRDVCLWLQRIQGSRVF